MDSTHRALEHSLLDTIRQHLHEQPSAHSAHFLFALSYVLAAYSQFSVEQILPQVLCRFRSWRTLSRDEKFLPDALEALAKELAALAHSLDPPPSRTLQIVWIPFSHTACIPSLTVLPAKSVAATHSGHATDIHGSENIPPIVPPHSRPRAATTALRPVVKPSGIPRRNTTSTKPLSKPAVLPPLRALPPPAPISYPPNKPRPWPLPDVPRPLLKKTIPRVALGRYNATES